MEYSGGGFLQSFLKPSTKRRGFTETLSRQVDCNEQRQPMEAVSGPDFVVMGLGGRGFQELHG